MKSKFPDRVELGRHIASRLEEHAPELIRQWESTRPIQHFVLDELLPADVALSIRNAFPEGSSMMLKRSLRELKFVAAQMNKYAPLLEEAIYAFQLPEVVDVVARITRLRELEPDSQLYAGGISLMASGHFLNPHIDNSHDRSRQRYRALNLLYYVSPDWKESFGGNLELWPNGPHGEPITIVSHFNRLAVMITHEGSWHSVSRNRSATERCCVSNYYFSKQPVRGESDYFHITSFRGRPEQPLRDLVLRADAFLRQSLRKVFPKGVKANPHFYDRNQ